MKDTTTRTVEYWGGMPKSARERARPKREGWKAEKALQVFTWNTCSAKGCTAVPRNKAGRRGEKFLFCYAHREMATEITMVEGDMSLITEKYDELTKYLIGKCYAWRADYSRYDDIVSGTMARLLVEEQEKGAFKDTRALWGRATNIVKEEIAQTFADRLPVSGVRFQAHWTATKALQAAGGDPRAAYGMQTGTSRVGRELIYAVAHGPSLYSPEYLQDLNEVSQEPTSSLTQQDEDNIRVAMYELSEQERQVVHLRMWMRMTNAQVAEEMGVSADWVRKIWKQAIKKLRPVLMKSFVGRFEES